MNISTEWILFIFPMFYQGCLDVQPGFDWEPMVSLVRRVVTTVTMVNVTSSTWARLSGISIGRSRCGQSIFLSMAGTIIMTIMIAYGYVYK